MKNKGVIMERFKNYGLWVSIFALIGMMLMDSNVIGELGRYQEYVQIVLGILVTAGIISNPKEGTHYLDSKNNE